MTRYKLYTRGVMAGAVALTLSAVSCDRRDAPSAPAEAAGTDLPPAPATVAAQPGTRAVRSVAPRAAMPATTLGTGADVPAQVSMFDASGAGYTLTTATGELRTPDGLVMRLDGEMTAIVLAEFQGAQEADVMAGELEHASVTPCTYVDPANPDCDMQEVRADQGAGVTPRRRVSFRWEYVAGPRRRATRGPGAGPLRRGLNKESVGAKWNVSAATQNFTVTCQNILDAALGQVAGYRTVRATLLEEIGATARAQAANGVINLIVTRESSWAEGVLRRTAEFMYVRASVGILGAYWNVLGCGSRRLSGGTFLRVGTHDIPFGRLACGYETWRISFDGGRTWSNVEVLVCQYEAQ